MKRLQIENHQALHKLYYILKIAFGCLFRNSSNSYLATGWNGFFLTFKFSNICNTFCLKNVQNAFRFFLLQLNSKYLNFWLFAGSKVQLNIFEFDFVQQKSIPKTRRISCIASSFSVISRFGFL